MCLHFRYIEWFLTDPYAAKQCENLDMVPLTDSVANKIIQEILPSIHCGENQVADLVAEQKYQEKIAQETWRLPVYIVTPLGERHLCYYSVIYH